MVGVFPVADLSAATTSVRLYIVVVLGLIPFRARNACVGRSWNIEIARLM